MLNLSARSIRRRRQRPPGLATEAREGLRRKLVSAWAAYEDSSPNPEGPRVGRRFRVSKAARKEARRIAALDQLAANRDRIAELRAKGLPLPGQSPEQAQAIRASQRRA